MRFPAPVVERHEGVLVVRDDLLEGGTKRRVIGPLFDHARELVYASPAEGIAQVALAMSAQDHGGKVTLFEAERKREHQNATRARELGASIVGMRPGYLTQTQARARTYAALSGDRLLVPFGLRHPALEEALVGLARSLKLRPKEVWSVAGSGVLTRCLQRAWPNARVLAVQIGHKLTEADRGRAMVFLAPEKFSQPAEHPPPFPSNMTYDAKAWRFIRERAGKGALFWNVAA